MNPDENIIIGCEDKIFFWSPWNILLFHTFEPPTPPTSYLTGKDSFYRAAMKWIKSKKIRPRANKNGESYPWHGLLLMGRVDEDTNLAFREQEMIMRYK